MGTPWESLDHGSVVGYLLALSFGVPELTGVMRGLTNPPPNEKARRRPVAGIPRVAAGTSQGRSGLQTPILSSRCQNHDQLVSSWLISMSCQWKHDFFRLQLESFTSSSQLSARSVPAACEHVPSSQRRVLRRCLDCKRLDMFEMCSMEWFGGVLKLY